MGKLIPRFWRSKWRWALPPVFWVGAVLAATDVTPAWRQNQQAGVSRTQFRQVIAAFEAEFARDAAEEGRTFEILHDWDTDWAQAFARRWETDHLVVYGGIARIAHATTDSLALILCHEVGHLYGGVPYSDETNRLSLEGQADWWATAHCWERVIHQLPGRAGNERERAVAAALTVTAFFASNRSLPMPRAETPDTSVVSRTNQTHPAPQCRLDTYLAGLLKQERPRCWWAPSQE